MKKTIAFLLTLILILSLTTPALAFSVRLSAQNLTVDGKQIECEKYNIDGSNYFKLRDIAYVLNGTGSQFSVGWDSGTKTVSVVTGEEYMPDGSELVIGGDKSETAVESSQTIQINGEVRSDLTVYNIGGSNFFKLRDLGDALGFEVDYDQETNSAIVRSRQAVQQPAGEVVVYSSENFAYRIPSDELEKHLKWGYSTEPQELVFDKKGEFGGSIKSTWKRSGRTILFNDQGTTVNSSTDPEDTPGSQFAVAPDIYSMFIVRGSTGFTYSLKGSATIGRVEIADTATKINTDFEGCPVKRIGVPSSVTSIRINSMDPNLVFYCEKDSKAEEFAAANGIRCVTASIVYDADGRTAMVTSEERPLYLGHGWYSEPVTRMYASDGRTKVVTLDRVAENVSVGWYEHYEDVYTTLYSMDGRTKDVLKINVEAEEAVGWYTLPHYLMAYADQLVTDEGYETAVEFLESLQKLDSANAAEYQQKIDQLLQKWMKEINCPLAILGYTITYNSIRTPEVNIEVRNLSQKTIIRLDITWTCRDAYGNITTDFPSLYNGNFTGYTDADSALAPGERSILTWTLYSNEQTAYITNYYVESVAYSDGTSWRK